MAKKTERKSDRRKKDGVENTKVHTDVVEVERNLIEQGIIALKHWYKDNPATIRWMIISILTFFILFLSFLFFHSTIVENHNKRLFQVISEYDESVQMNIPALKSAKLKDVEKQAAELCNHYYPTDESYHACIIASLAAGQNNRPKEMSAYLKKYTDHFDGDGPSTLTAFYTAYAYEMDGNYKMADVYYEKWGEYLKDKEIKNQDAVLFHRMRMAYYMKDRKKALEYASKILKDFPNSMYKSKVVQYRYLIYSNDQ